MSSFKEHSNIAPHGEQWINTKTFRFYHDDSKTGIYDEVPEGFVFDGCSIPLCIFGQKIEPATLTPCCYHDWLVRYKPYGYWKTQYLFLIAMRVDSVKVPKRLRYFIGVCIGCWVTRYITGETSKLRTLIGKYIP